MPWIHSLNCSIHWGPGSIDAYTSLSPATPSSSSWGILNHCYWAARRCIPCGWSWVNLVVSTLMVVLGKGSPESRPSWHDTNQICETIAVRHNPLNGHYYGNICWCMHLEMICVSSCFLFFWQNKVDITKKSQPAPFNSPAELSSHSLLHELLLSSFYSVVWSSSLCS